ncbi:hypothetical protein BDA99DRAFT_433348 [Phascolomyces articulosus]|uniref:NADH-cytochrome b5 reductase n=1 Tax=Phascolomyces articulosus TaxID=60185 RepID=A0AAD5K6Q2_9FUNG|nr:hypothetical protein BDA99DRAFT_433348 [Phascolomyces articulosus]
MFRRTTIITTSFRRSISTTTTINNANNKNSWKYFLSVATTCAGLYVGWKAWQWRQFNDTRLSPDRFAPLELIAKEQLTHDAYRLRLKGQVQQGEAFSTLSCLYIKDDNIQVMRSYTPINDPFHDGHVDLIIKRYQQGSISKMLARTQLHEKVFVRGPIEEYPYEPNSKSEIGMIAGGTGITPMYQLIKSVLNNPNDKTPQMWLIYCNKTQEDILLRTELDELAEKHKDRFQILYVLDHPPSTTGWQGGSGYVSREMIEKMMKKKDDAFVFVCGPDAMLNHVSGQRARDFTQGSVTGILGQMGFTSNQVWKLE